MVALIRVHEKGCLLLGTVEKEKKIKRKEKRRKREACRWSFMVFWKTIVRKPSFFVFAKSRWTGLFDWVVFTGVLAEHLTLIFWCIHTFLSCTVIFSMILKISFQRWDWWTVFRIFLYFDYSKNWEYPMFIKIFWRVSFDFFSFLFFITTKPHEAQFVHSGNLWV